MLRLRLRALPARLLLAAGAAPWRLQTPPRAPGGRPLTSETLPRAKALGPYGPPRAATAGRAAQSSIAIRATCSPIRIE